MARLGAGAATAALLLTAALSEVARAALPPLSYPVSPKTTDIRALVLGSQTGRFGVSLTLEDTAAPAASGIHLWQQDGITGRFSPFKFVSVPDVYAHLPLRLGNPLHHDVFYATHGGSAIQCGVLRGQNGAYDPAGSVIASYPATIAPPKGIVVGHTSSFNGSPGPDVALLIEPGKLVLFKDDGAGSLDPAYETLVLPNVQGSTLAVGDVTGDGRADVVIGSAATDEIVVFANTSTGGTTTVAERQRLSIPGFASLALADLDGNGATTLDLMTTSGPTELWLYLTGGAPFASPQVVGVDAAPVALGADDLRPADGDLDVFVACRSGATYGTLVELTNGGAGTVGRSGQYLGSSTTTSLANGTGQFVALHDAGASRFTIYPMSKDGLNLSPADGIAAAAGPNPAASSLVRFYRGDGLWISTADVIPYASALYGARVSNGNVDGTETLHAQDELLTGPGPSPALGPHVKAFRRRDLGVDAVAKVNFYAYGTLQGGVHVGGSNIDSDASDEIVTGPGPVGVFGPHVRAFNYDGVALQAMAKVNFYAYGTLRFGVEVGNGWDGEDDGFDEIPTGPGPGPTFGPTVRGFNYDGSALTAIAAVNFVAFPAPTGYGCSVQGGDADADGFDEIIAGRGPGTGQQAQFRGFDYDGMTIRPMQGLDVVAFSSMYGGRMAEGNVDGDLIDESDELAAGAGPDPTADSTVKVLRYDGTQLLPGPAFTTVPVTGYGVNAGGVYFGF